MALVTYHVRPDARTAATSWSGAVTTVNDNSSTTYSTVSSYPFGGSATFTLADATITGLGSSTFVYSVRPIGVFGPLTADGAFSVALNGLSSTSNYLGTTFSSGTIGLTAPSRAADGVVTITATHAFAVGDYVLITGNSTSWVNGTWQVTTVTGTTAFTFQHPETSAASGTASTGTFYRVNLVGARQYLDSAGANWSQTAINNLSLNCAGWNNDPTLNNPRLYELWGEVTVYDLPSITLTAIGDDTVSPWAPTNSATPLITWTYTQTQNAPQTGVVMKLFATTTATPETTTPLWSSTITNGATSTQITYSMLNGTTYQLYYKVASGGNGAQNYGAWSSNVAITPAFTVPTVPTITSATYNSTTERVAIVIPSGTAFASASQSYQLQRSDDGGTTYYDVRGCSSFNTTAAATAPAAITVYDYEAKRNTTVRYRIRAKSSLVTSAWSSATTSAISATTQWAMVAFDSDAGAAAGTLTKTYVGVPVQNQMDVEIVESTGVFRPLGSTKSVVIHGVLTGQDGKYELAVSSVADRDSVLAVINSQSTIMVSNPLNEIKYIRVVSRNFRLEGQTTRPFYRFDIGYIEVASGLSS